LMVGQRMRNRQRENENKRVLAQSCQQ
jgi:hypothetical protein